MPTAHSYCARDDEFTKCLGASACNKELLHYLSSAPWSWPVLLGLSLQEFSALQKYSEDERAAEKRSDAIHAVVLVALQTATTFSSLGFDLTADEKKYALADGEALLSQLEARQEQIAPIVKNIVNSGEQKILVDAVSEIRRTWEEMKSDMTQDDQDAFSFHVLAVVRHSARLRDVVGMRT